MTRPLISNKAFWDVAFESIDFEKSSLFVMQKVFNYGSWDDQLAVLRFYGSDRIRNEITKAAWLRPSALSFLCTILHLQKTDFECYINMQSNPLPWKY